MVSRFSHMVDLFTWCLRIAAIATFILSLYFIIKGEFWLGFLGNASPFSLGAMAILYLLSEHGLSHAQVGRINSVVLSALFANSFVALYELIYYFTYPIHLNYFRPPFLSGEGIRFLALQGLAILPILLMKQQLSIKKLSIVTLAILISIWSIWILYGFPQYFVEGYFYQRIFETVDPSRLSLVLNFGSKTMLAAFFASIIKFR